VCRSSETTDRGVTSFVYSCLECSVVEDREDGVFCLDLKKARMLVRIQGKARRAAPRWVYA
jgi:hypothetical protein